MTTSRQRISGAFTKVKPDKNPQRDLRLFQLILKSFDRIVNADKQPVLKGTLYWGDSVSTWPHLTTM